MGNFANINHQLFPFISSVAVANELEVNGIHTTLIPDSSVGYFMNQVNLVIMGAEAVLETGGIFNKLGSLQIGVLAKTFNVPVYIATGRKCIFGLKCRNLQIYTHVPLESEERPCE